MEKIADKFSVHVAPTLKDALADAKKNYEEALTERLDLMDVAIYIIHATSGID